jgi:hypothetical protein
MSSWIIPGRYDFSVPEAQWLSDLNGLDTDFDVAIRLCRRYLAESTRLSKVPEVDQEAWIEDFFTVGEIFFAAVVRYGRTFTSGARSGIPAEWIAALPKDLQEAHRYFKTLRDKFIAHSVNRLEDNQVFVIFTTSDDGIEQPRHITVDKGRLIAPSQEEVEVLRKLCLELRAKVEAEIKLETDRLLHIAQTMPVEVLKARGTESVAIPTKAETYRVRRGFK